MTDLAATFAPPPTMSSARTRALLRKLPVVAFVLATAYMVLMPLLRVQQLAAENGGAGYRSAANEPRILKTLLTTVQLAVGSVAIALVVGTALAFWSTRLPRGFRWLSIVPVLPIVTPAPAAFTGWAFLLSPEVGYLNSLLRALPFIGGDTGPINVYSTFWIIVIVGFSASAFVYLFVRAGLGQINEELVQAAETCGSSSTAAFFRVTLPLLRPVLVYAGATVLLLALGQVTAPLILGRREAIDVLTTVMVRFSATTPPDYGAAAAVASPLMVIGVVVVVAQRALLGDRSRFVTHGGKAFRRTGRPSKLAAVVFSFYGLVSVLAPLIALTIVALSPFWTPQIHASQFTLDNFRAVFERPEIVSAIRNSVVLSFGSVAISLPVGFIAATIIHRRRHRVLARILDFLVNLPLGVPAAVFGIGFLLTYTRPPFVLYGSTWVILLVYVTLMLPFTTRFQLSALVSIGSAYEEASKTSGAGTLRTSLEIILPLMRPALVSSSTMMLILLSQEFSASLLVRSVKVQVMGTQLYDYWTTGSYTLVAAVALTMCAITTAGVLIATLVGGRDALERL